MTLTFFTALRFLNIMYFKPTSYIVDCWKIITIRKMYKYSTLQKTKLVFIRKISQQKVYKYYV